MRRVAEAGVARDRQAIAIPWWSLALLLLLGALVASISPAEFEGGVSDDQRYFDAAYAWLQHGPVVGATHWALRLPFILPIAAAFRVFGVSLFPMAAIPLLYFLGTLLIVFATVLRFTNQRVAWIWAGLFITTPLIHRMATTGYPDIAETFFVAASLFAFTRGVGAAAARPRWLLIAGVAGSLAILTRETAGYLVLIYGAILLFGRPVSRRSMMWVLAGAVPLIAIETVWLWWHTGDWLYRAHVSLNHVHLPSQVRQGEIPRSDSVLFNPEVASRWEVRGPINVHWAVNPIIYFFIEKRYGLTFWLLIGLLVAAGRRLEPQRRRLLAALLCVAVAAFLFQTYVLMVSQRPRFYAIPVTCAIVASAVLLDRLLAEHRRIGLLLLPAVALIQLGLFVSTETMRQPHSFVPDVAVPLIAGAAPRVYTEPSDADILRTPLALSSRGTTIVGAPTPPGGLNLVIVRKGDGALQSSAIQPKCCWRIEGRKAAPLFWWQSHPSFLLILRRRIT